LCVRGCSLTFSSCLCFFFFLFFSPFSFRFVSCTCVCVRYPLLSNYNLFRFITRCFIETRQQQQQQTIPGAWLINRREPNCDNLMTIGHLFVISNWAIPNIFQADNPPWGKCSLRNTLNLGWLSNIWAFMIFVCHFNGLCNQFLSVYLVLTHGDCFKWPTTNVYYNSLKTPIK